MMEMWSNRLWRICKKLKSFSKVVAHSLTYKGHGWMIEQSFIGPNGFRVQGSGWVSVCVIFRALFENLIEQGKKKKKKFNGILDQIVG